MPDNLAKSEHFPVGVDGRTAHMKQQTAGRQPSSSNDMSATAGMAAGQSRNTGRKTTGVDKRIYNAVSGAVMSHQLPPGTKLTAASLCGLFHVSRTTVRKTLLRLAHEQILELRPFPG